MTVINIQGKRVTVGEEFLSLSPEEQNDTVEEIASSFGVTPQAETLDPLTKKNEDGYDTSGDADFNVLAADKSAGQTTEVQGQSYDEGGVPLGANSQTPIIGPDTPAEGMTPAPSGSLNEITDEQGNLTSRMYESVPSYGDALKVYETIANHPDAEVSKSAVPGGLDTIIFRGKRVPVPEPASFGQGAKVGSVQLGGEQIIQTASSIMDLVSSSVNVGIGAVTGKDDVIPLANRARINSEGLVDNIQAELPALVGTGAAGLRAGNLIVGGNPMRLAGPMGGTELAEGLVKRYAGTLTKGKALEKAAIQGTGVNVAMTAGMDNDASGLFTGEDAAIADKINILSRDGKSQSGEILANKVNLIADASITGLMASGVASSIGLAKKIVYDGIIKNIAGIGSESVQQNKVIEEILSATSDLGPDATPGQMKSYAERVRTIVANNSEVLARTPDGGIDTSLDPLAALASALEQSGSKADNLAAERVRTTRNDVFGANLPETNQKQKGYTETVDDFGRELYDAGGGAQGVESARSGIVQSGRDEVAVASGAADVANTNLEKNTAKIEQIFRMDATVGQKLAALEKEGVDINIYRKGNEALEKTVDRIAKGETTLREARDTAYDNLTDAIPEDATFNDPTFDDLFGDAKAYIKPSVTAKIEGMDVNSFKTLRTDLLPAVNSAIKQTQPGTGPYQALLDLKQNIEVDQLASLNPEVKAVLQQNIDEVTAANENYYNWFSKGPLKDVSNSQRSVNTFKESGNVNRSTELTAADRSSSTIDSLFNNTNRGQLQLVGEFLQTPEGGKSAKPLVDVGIAKMVQASRKTAQTDGVGAIDSQQLISSISNFASTLEKVSPQQYTRLQDIITNLRKYEKNGVELERIAKEAEDLAKNTDSAVLDKELVDFFKGSGANRQEITQGQEVFNGIFNDKKMFDQKVDNLIVRADQSGPEARNGLKAAFGKFIKFNPTDIAKNEERTLDIANRIYADQPEVVEAIETAFKLVKNTQVGEGSRVGVLSAASETESKGLLGLNRAITMLFGVLNPTATKIRTLTSIAAKNYNPKDNMIRLIGEIASDTPTFLNALDEYINKGIVNDPKRIFDFMVKAGVYSNTDEDYDRFNAGIEEVNSETMNQGPVDDTEKALR